MTEDQFLMIAGLLTEIRDALVPQDEAPDGCPHPDEARVSLATPGDPEHWVCIACRYTHRSTTLAGP